MIEERDFIKNNEMNVKLIWIDSNPLFGVEEQVMMESDSRIGTFLMSLSVKEAETLTGLKEKEMKGKVVAVTLKCKVKTIFRLNKRKRALYL